jgi:hypothetical protein
MADPRLRKQPSDFVEEALLERIGAERRREEMQAAKRGCVVLERGGMKCGGKIEPALQPTACNSMRSLNSGFRPRRTAEDRCLAAVGQECG